VNTSQCTNYQMPSPLPPAARYHAALVAVSIQCRPSCCRLAKRLFEFFCDMMPLYPHLACVGFGIMYSR
jgi:hypothetical protein